MSGSHRRRRWFSIWRSRRRLPSSPGRNATASGRCTPCVTPMQAWANAPTRNLPVLRSAPLMTPAQIYRGNGGRWVR